jgi:hypothetical protein
VSAAVYVERRLFQVARADLAVGAEQIGFFLADFEPDECAFVLREWHLVPTEGTVRQGLHVELTDETKNAVIASAWSTGLCLVEAHSHGDWAPAEFSSTDLDGFDTWVPHLFWRLRGRPYAALVTAADTVDAVAWVDDPKVFQAVAVITIDGDPVATTGRTARSSATGAGGS